MLKFAKNTQATVISCLRYRDAPVAIEWLCNTFGFGKHLVVPNVDGTIAHAQLSFGNGMIMLGSVQKNETEFGRLMTQPDEIGGGQTQSSYMVVTDADAVYACAKTAGAKLPSKSRTRITAAGVSAASTLKATCGTSALTTPRRAGDSVHRRHE